MRSIGERVETEQELVWPPERGAAVYPLPAPAVGPLAPPSAAGSRPVESSLRSRRFFSRGAESW